MEGHNLPAPSYKTHTHTQTADKIFPKMPSINYTNTLLLSQAKLISYNQNNKHILSYAPPMIYL